MRTDTQFSNPGIGFGSSNLMIRILLIGSVLLGCGSSKTEEESQQPGDDAPTVPPSSTIDLDLGVQGDADQSIEEDMLLLANEAASWSNLTGHTRGLKHGIAAIAAFGIHTSVRVALSVPTLMIRRAASESPTYMGDNRWLWSYDVVHEGVTYTANYTGFKESDSSSQWSMRVTTNSPVADGCCTDFLFFTGSMIDGSVGSWEIFDPEDHDAGIEKLFSISYDIQSADEKLLTFTAQKEKPANQAFGKGSTVRFEVNPSSHKIIHQDVVDAAPTSIEWNRSSIEGQLTGKDGKNICWGTQEEGFPDRDCEP